MNGIRSVQKLAADAAIEDQTTKEWAASEAAPQGDSGGQEGQEGGVEEVGGQEVGANRAS